VRALTPEPAAGHWLFSSKVQHVVDFRPVPFNILPLGDERLAAFARSVARTVPLGRRLKDPPEGEVLVTTFKHHRATELSMHPNHLVPWVPVVGGEVIVVTGAWLGAVGVAKEKQGNQWVVTFTVDDDVRDKSFEEKELAALEST
jgi:hypothetical protein